MKKRGEWGRDGDGRGGMRWDVWWGQQWRHRGKENDKVGKGEKRRKLQKSRENGERDAERRQEWKRVWATECCSDKKGARVMEGEKWKYGKMAGKANYQSERGTWSEGKEEVNKPHFELKLKWVQRSKCRGKKSRKRDRRYLGDV